MSIMHIPRRYAPLFTRGAAWGALLLRMLHLACVAMMLCRAPAASALGASAATDMVQGAHVRTAADGRTGSLLLPPDVAAGAAIMHASPSGSRTLVHDEGCTRPSYASCNVLYT